MASGRDGLGVGAPRMWPGIARSLLAAGPLRIAISSRVDGTRRSIDLEFAGVRP